MSRRSSRYIGSISTPSVGGRPGRSPTTSSSGSFTLVYGHCLAGIVANEELDVAEAERWFREALRVARRSLGVQSHARRLASALLGEVLYERGDVDEADLLLDESYQLGAEGGVVEFMIARYVTGARIKAVRGDRGAAARAWTRVRGPRQLSAFPGCAPTSKTSGCGWTCRSPNTRGGMSTGSASRWGTR